MNKCQEKNTYLENQSRRNNIRVYGVKEKPREHGKKQKQH